jgi:DNA-directed RNA polymerase subunit M/transcription elongation factor TFIIS|tara:strand:+ start:370 stop:831 length:462 start_codon:yes stop_codon:yes gene_type:complete
MSKYFKKKKTRDAAQQLFINDLKLSASRARDIEKHVFSTCDTSLQYTQRIRKMLYNIKMHPSPLDIKDISNTTDLCWLKSIHPLKYAAFIAKNDSTRNAHEQTLVFNSDEKSLLQCSYCKKFTVTYFLRQTRSADEPMTCFAKCHTCDRSWRQ